MGGSTLLSNESEELSALTLSESISLKNENGVVLHDARYVSILTEEENDARDKSYLTEVNMTSHDELLDSGSTGNNMTLPDLESHSRQREKECKRELNNQRKVTEFFFRDKVTAIENDINWLKTVETMHEIAAQRNDSNIYWD